MLDVILIPNRNVWRIERAERAAVLADATYFSALREALTSGPVVTSYSLAGVRRSIRTSSKASASLKRFV